jgi:hypothetical protein
MKYKPYKEAEKSDRRQRKAARRSVFDYNKGLHSKRSKHDARVAKAKAAEAVK